MGVTEVWACVARASGDRCALYLRRHGEDFHEHRCVGVPFFGGGHWQIVALPVATHLHWHGKIVQLRLDAFKRPCAGVRRVG